MLTLITENQLDQWVRFNSRDAQGTIVELVWRLAAATCPKPRERRFPLTDSIGQHGPDGVLDVELSYEPFIPEGRSFWEIGTGLRSRDKATSDYNELTSAVPESIRLETTFVFVTPLSGRRDWEYSWKEEEQAVWLDSHCKRGEWNYVRVIDGTKLVDWIHQFPAVELWLNQKMRGIPPEQIEIPEQQWSVVSSIGEPPPLTPDLFLANRTEASTKLRDVINGTMMQLRLTTHYPDQVVDFVSAYLASLDDETRIDAIGRCLIVSSVDAWNRICASTQWRNQILVADPSLNLIEDHGTKLIQKARRAGHAIIFGGPHGGVPDPTSVPLPMPHTDQVQEALKKAGYSEERARTLAKKSNGNISSLLRCLQNLSVLPEWAVRSEAAELVIALLLGSWNEKSDADRAIVENLSGKIYGEWIRQIRDIVVRPSTPLNQQDGIWRFIPRYEGWYALGPRIFDEHLERLKITALSVFREKDPKFDLPPEDRFVAIIHSKVLSHSQTLRNSLAETLALLGSHPKAFSSCSINNVELTASITIREIFEDVDWILWASLNDLLPLLAEAAPEEFLNAVEKELNHTPCAFDEIFAQEGKGLFGNNYMTGLLWALETLAWDENHLSRVVICLGYLAKRDPGGQWMNRPANSLTTIFLPWLPQTCAPNSKRVTSVRTLLTELPDVGWKLLLSLFPQLHSVSSRTRRPAWRMTIPIDWHQEVTRSEYWEQVNAYTELAIDEVSKDILKLADLIEHIENIPQETHGRILNYIGSDNVLELLEENRLLIWNKIVDLVNKHRRFSDAKWAMQTEQVEKFAELADRLAPTSPLFRNQRLFTEDAFNLYDDDGDYDKQWKDLEDRRRIAVEEVAAYGGIDAVLAFAKIVESPWRVGFAFGVIVNPDGKVKDLPALLDHDNDPSAQFIGGFIWGCFYTHGWKWVDRLEMSAWTPIQKGKFLSYLPFILNTWERAKNLLGEDQSNYWMKTTANPYEANTSLEIAVIQLLEYGRPYAAIRCIYKMLHDNQPLNNPKAVQALLAAMKSSEVPNSTDIRHVIGVIQALQNDQNTNLDDLLKIEWAYLPILDENHRASPKMLFKKLGDSPKFFCEIIRLAFKSKKEEYRKEFTTEEEKNAAVNAHHLLSEWQAPPGLNEDGTYDGNTLKLWLEYVIKECTETGHVVIALEMVGSVLAYTPADPSGLWINRTVAEVLDAKDAQYMRNGFQIELLNSRGVYWVDPSGKPEKELATKYRIQAEAVESSGYNRLAATLRELEKMYDREAEKVKFRESFDD